jgi:hypothetical protein
MGLKYVSFCRKNFILKESENKMVRRFGENKREREREEDGEKFYNMELC